MKYKLGVFLFGLIEIAIGLITLISLLASLILAKSTKPPEVFIFVFTTSILSLSLGMGILRYSLRSYHLLLFFASVIILSKILIFLKIINLSGALETQIPAPLKNIASTVYHSILIWFFNRPRVKKQFGERRDFLKCHLRKP